MELDDQDLKILTTLYRIDDPSPKVIADEIDLPKSTVHYRLKRLREEGVLKNELHEFDPDAVGLNVTVISEVIAEYDEGYHHEVGDQVAEIDGVSQVYFTMGDTDFIVISTLPNSDAIERLITQFEAIDQIQRTSSSFVITTVKNEPNPVRNYGFDRLAEFELSTE